MVDTVLLNSAGFKQEEPCATERQLREDEANSEFCCFQHKGEPLLPKDKHHSTKCLFGRHLTYMMMNEGEKVSGGNEDNEEMQIVNGSVTYPNNDGDSKRSENPGCAERLCAFYVDRPKLAFALALGLQVSLIIITGILYIANYDIFPYNFSEIPLNLQEDVTKLRADAFNFVNDDPRIDLQPAIAIHQPERTLQSSPLEIIFKLKEREKKNIVTSKNLRDIATLEKLLYSNPSYQKICLRNVRLANCSKPISVIRLFDGTFKMLHPGLHDPKFERIAEVFNIAANISKPKSVISFSLDKNYVIQKDRVYSEYIRSLTWSGMPLVGYEHTGDRKKEQLNKLRKCVVNAFSDVLEQKYEDGIGDLNVFYLNLDLFYDAVQHQVIWDLFLAGGSLVFIFCFIWFQTGSLWITGWAVFGIVTNFFGANLIYRLVLDFRFIGVFHVLSVFLILGIGADDIFVFYNTWKLMEAKSFSNLTQHLTATFRSAAGAMFVTSLTTAAAFFASAASPLLAVSSFGVFSGILVIVNFFSVCLYFPSVVVNYHYYWKERNVCCPTKPKMIDGFIEEHDKGAAPQEDMTKLFKAVVRWFETTYASKFVLHGQVKWVVLSVFAIMSAVFFVFAIRLGPDEKMTQVWPKGTNWYDMRQIKINAFEEKGEGTNVIRVYIVWGLKVQDRSSCHFTDFKCRGQTVFDDSFDMNKLGCQESMLKFCRRLKSLSPEKAQSLKIRRSVASGELEVSCFIEDMDRALKAESQNPSHMYSASQETNFSIPMYAGKVKALMSNKPTMFNVSQLTNEYYYYFEAALGYWLSGGGNPKGKHDYFKYAAYMGGSLDKTVTDKNDVISLSQGGRYGNRLRYVAVVVNTSITGATIQYNEGRETYDNWEKYIEEEMKLMPESCRGAFQCTPEWNNWEWLKVQKELLHGARNGIIIGLGVAFPVLVFTTCNWIIGILAILTIGLITLAVVGLIPLLGWSLGVMESINLTLVVGLSVDYAVHLADGYVRCCHTRRDDRVKHMLGHVGVSVLAGASTTLGASAFMLGSRIIFFFQFGVFMFCTIGFSIVYALMIFTVLAGVIGPEGEGGSLKYIFNCFNCLNDYTSDGERQMVPTDDKDAKEDVFPYKENYNVVKFSNGKSTLDS